MSGGPAANLPITSGNTQNVLFYPLFQRFMNLELTSYFKPNTNHDHTTARYFTFTDGSNRRLTMWLKDVNVGMNPSMIIEIYGNPIMNITCDAESPILANEWTAFTVGISEEMINCCIHGVCQEVAFDAVSDDHLNFEIEDWYLGAPVDGVVGYVDNIQLKILAPLPGDLPKKKLIVVVVFLLLFGMLGVLGHKYRSDLTSANPCAGENHSRSYASKKPSQKSPPPKPKVAKPNMVKKQSREEGEATTKPPPAPSRFGGFFQYKSFGT